MIRNYWGCDLVIVDLVIPSLSMSCLFNRTICWCWLQLLKMHGRFFFIFKHVKICKIYEEIFFTKCCPKIWGKGKMHGISRCTIYRGTVYRGMTVVFFLDWYSWICLYNIVTNYTNNYSTYYTIYQYLQFITKPVDYIWVFVKVVKD